MAATANIKPSEIVREFKEKVVAEIELVPEGIDRFVVDVPITFDDGDALPIVLRKDGDAWALTDEAHTFMQLSYVLSDDELRSASRREIIDKALASASVENRSGELVLPIPDHLFGDALYSFIQTLLRVDAVRYLSRERVQSTFVADVRQYLEQIVSVSERASFDWRDPERDPQGIYSVDCRINSMKTPLFVFAINSEEKAANVTINLLKYEQWKLDFKSVGIFDDMEKYTNKTIAKLSDAIGKTFSTLEAAEERLLKFFPEVVRAQEIQR